jgi:hypothetical protein
MVTIAPSQQFAGIINARDWPMTPPIEGALYLIFIQANPLNGGTQSQNKFEYICQWMWYLIGTNIPSSEQAENRGDRYRTSMGIVQNLRQANYPCFCKKQTYSCNPVTGVVTGTPFTSPSVGGAESIWWTFPKFMQKSDNNKSGLVYGICAVNVYGFDDVLASVA